MWESLCSFWLNDTATTEIYTLSLHDALPIYAILAALRELIEHCKDPTAGGHTPSDFPGARVSQANLDKLLSKIGRKGSGSDGA